MPSKKKSSRSNSTLAKSRVKKISVKLPSAENKIHRNKDIPGYKSWKSKADEILEVKKKSSKILLRRYAKEGQKKPVYTINQITRKKKSEMNTATNLSRKARNIKITPRTKKELSNAKLRHIRQQAKKKSFKGPKKIHQRGPSKLRIVKTANNIASNKAKNLVKMQQKRESELNNNRRNYDFVNNAPTREEAAAAAAPNSQPSILGNIMSGVSRLFQSDSERKSHV